LDKVNRSLFFIWVGYDLLVIVAKFTTVIFSTNHSDNINVSIYF